MSLDYRLGGIANWEKTCKNEDGTLTTECENIVLGTMAVDIGEITDKNYVEMAFRFSVLAGISEFGSEAFRAISEPEVIRKYIGLRTNVITKTRNQWFSRQADLTMRTLQWKESERLQKITSEMTAD